MTKADALAPIIALEATVVGGRTYQAYRRGKGDEARERFIEESTGSVVWLFGVGVLSKLGDKILQKILKNKNVNFDVGKDKLRTPFDNFVKKAANNPKRLSQTTIAMLKGIKILSSIIIANLFIGFAVPKINHALTNHAIERKKAKEQNKSLNHHSTQHSPSAKQTEHSSPSFKGSAISAMNTFTNVIENTNVGKLLSTDIGIAGGRMYNARTKEERREIGFRDISSIYFYMWAQGHVGNILNFVQSGRFTRLNPTTAGILDEHLQSFLEKNGGEISVEEFKKAVLGQDIKEIKIPEGIKFESDKPSAFTKFMNNFRKKPKETLEVAKVSDIEKVITDAPIRMRIRQMSTLQPQRVDGAVITKRQLLEALSGSEIHNPKLLDQAFSEFSGGTSTDSYKYISNKKLYNLKNSMEDYVKDICKAAKDGKVNKKLLNKMKSDNLAYNGINFVAGFLVAAAFLSTFIPKIQYYITRKTTGIEGFPAGLEEGQNVTYTRA